jgi:hypothetical protein
MCCNQQRAHDWVMQHGHTAANMRSGDNRAHKQLLGNCVVRLDWIECVGRGRRLQPVAQGALAHYSTAAKAVALCGPKRDSVTFLSRYSVTFVPISTVKVRSDGRQHFNF